MTALYEVDHLLQELAVGSALGACFMVCFAELCGSCCDPDHRSVLQGETVGAGVKSLGSVANSLQLCKL